MSKREKLSLYPLKFQEVIADVLKVKPEPKERKAKGQPKIQKKFIKSKAKRTYGKQGY